MQAAAPKLVVDPKNRMNDLPGRNWLQFQKSWFVYSASSINDFVQFFTKIEYPDGRRGTAYLWSLEKLAPALDDTSKERLLTDDRHAVFPLDYAFFDAVPAQAEPSGSFSIDALAKHIEEVAARLRNNMYFTVAIRNSRIDSQPPAAWHLSKILARHFLLKDEKIGCLETLESCVENAPVPGWQPDDSIIYFLNFRKEIRDEQPAVYPASAPGQLDKKSVEGDGFATGPFRESWFVHRPPRRSKDVILHPAKFPEDLIAKYIRTFTKEQEWVFDPMAGTGSSLIAALDCDRRACGIELNPDFVALANKRVEDTHTWKLVEGDSKSLASYDDLPEFYDYCITSPPYWDMLRMRGAETQKKRKDQGLQRWYSDDERDLGNIDDYESFIAELRDIYAVVAKRLQPGRYLTIIVKNVKKKGVIYPLAWDLTFALQDFLVFKGEQFWCQDDQRLAPFGYRYSWVSNTFHHYCLTFQKL